MLSFVSIQVLSLVYLILILCVFLYKKNSRNLEGVMYEVLLLLTMIVVLFDVASNLMIYQNPEGVLTNIIGKSYLIMCILWCFWLTIYVSNINIGKEYKTIKELFKGETILKWTSLLTALLASGVLFLNSNYVVDEVTNASFQNGPAVYYTYLISIIFVGICVIYSIINPRNIKFVKRIPIFVFVLIAVVAIVIQWSFNWVLLVTSAMSFVMVFFYFTIENPDQKIINELQEDKKEVEEASKAKTDFLSNMSHDIRTPMNAIIGFSESLLMENLSENQKSEVQNIYEAATTLLAIINNILDVSRIESGKEEKNEKPYEFKKVLMQLISVITAKIDNSKVKLNVQIDKTVPTHFIGDELKLYQILMNILSNAAKYTEVGHIDFTITSQVEGDTAKLKFVIADTGIGIKESDYDKMFVKFSRIHNQENYREIEGTGLGLVITKSLTELLGGTISFTSEYGKGTTFTVEIPQKIYRVTDPDAFEQKRVANVNNVHFDGSLYDVLVVDDNNLNLKVAERILSDYHFHITLAQSGEEAIQKIKDGNKYDIIFLDHMMPIMDGIQTLKIIKSLEGYKVPPCIALTANAMVGMKEMYLNEGFDGYISKPINREELQDLLNNYFCHK
jgi:signal transduction histidine kinase/CheY-like chemotaxis protein